MKTKILDMVSILVSKKNMTTKEAFEHFINNGYKAIKPKPSKLRLYVSRYKQDNKLSEEKMIEILAKYQYTPKAWKSIPTKWIKP